MNLTPKEKDNIIRAFNNKPKNGMDLIRTFCKSNPLETEKEIAEFFHKEKKNLDLEAMGDYLGTDGEENKKILEHFTKEFNFKKKSFSESLRTYLEAFKLPGEAQKIDRLVKSFSITYCKQNSNQEIKDQDAAYILAFQTIMLNTDLHNSSISPEKKMTFEGLKKNLRGTNGAQDFDEKFLKQLYEEIKAKPFAFNFTKIPPGYEISGIDSSENQILNKLLSGNECDVTKVFPKLNHDELELKIEKPKSWLNKFTGYEGNIEVNHKDGEKVCIQVYNPNIFSKWLFGEKSKVIIQPIAEEGKESTGKALELASKIAASFTSGKVSWKATYDYEVADLSKKYCEFKVNMHNIHPSVTNQTTSTAKVSKNKTTAAITR